MSENHILLKNRDSLLLFPKQQLANDEVFWVQKEENEVKIPLKLSISEVYAISNASSHTIFVDENKLQFPLTIRRWNEGDVFHPFGMTGKKKLSKYFKDEKFSLLDKANTWLLCSDDKIIWIVGKRQDERFKIEDNTTKILKINYTD